MAAAKLSYKETISLSVCTTNKLLCTLPLVGVPCAHNDSNQPCCSFEKKAAAAAAIATPVEIIYVSSDRTANDQAKRMADLKMLSIPFGATAELKQRYRIWSGAESGTFGTGRRSGVPALVVLDRDGHELAFLAAESKGAAALQDWPLDDPRAVWGG